MFFSRNRHLGQFFLVVAMSVCLCVCPIPMQFSRGSKGGPRGAKPVRLLKEHVHHLEFPDEKIIECKASLSPWRTRPSPAISLRLEDPGEQSQSVSSKNTSITWNFLMKKESRAKLVRLLEELVHHLQSCDEKNVFLMKNVIVLVLLPVSVERFFFSRMRDF